MKTVKIVLALLAAVVIFNSCTKEYAVPTITWTPDNLSQFVDFEEETTWNQTLNITFGAEAGISEIKIWKHVYTASEIDPTTTLLDAPTGYDALTTFAYAFTTTHAAADFAGGVTKIVYEFEVTDASETPQTTAKEYTFFSEDVYSVTINVEDEQGVAITDATVTFGGIELTAAPYVFNYVPEGTYEYSVVKAGYATVTVTDFAMAAADTAITVEMLMNIDATWNGPIMLTLDLQDEWATYGGVRVDQFISNEIGVECYGTNENIAQIRKTSNCDGWVVVNNIDNLTTVSTLETAYSAGTPVNQMDLNIDHYSKTYQEVYFIARFGSVYKLVHFKEGARNSVPNPTYNDTVKGVVVVFEYKD